MADYDYTLPEKALRAAESMPEIMAPLLLERLERTFSNGERRSDADEWIELYALFLLAEFKEGRTLELLKSALGRGAQRSKHMEFPEESSQLFASWAFNKRTVAGHLRLVRVIGFDFWGTV